MTLFVWIGCGTAISTQAFSAFNPDTPLDNDHLLAIAMAFGWGIVVLAYSIAPISGMSQAFAVVSSLSTAVPFFD